MARTIELDAPELLRRINVIVKVKNMRQFRIRFWLSTRLIMLASFIGGFHIEIKDMEDGKS